MSAFKIILTIFLTTSALSAQIRIGGVSIFGSTGHGTFNVLDYGAVGNGTTDDKPAFAAACLAAYNAGGGVIYIPAPPSRYAFNSGGVDCYGRISLAGVGAASVIVARTSSGAGITISSCLSTAYTPSCPNASSVIDRTATGAIAVGNFSLTLSNITGLSVGDTVYMWLGDDPTDSVSHSLPFINMFNTISAIAGSVVSFSDPIPEAVADPAIVMRTHHVWKPQGIAENISVSGLSFERDATSGNTGYQPFRVQYARNVYINNISATDTTFGLLGLYYGANYQAETIQCNHMLYDGNTSGGVCIAGWSTQNINIKNLLATDVNSALSFEGQNRIITVDGCYISEGQSGTPASTFIGFNGNSLGTAVRNCDFTASSSTITFNAVGNAIILENINLYNKVHIFLERMQGSVSYNGARPAFRTVWSKDFQITPNMSSVQISTPQGWYAKVNVYVSSVTGITRFALLNNNGGIDYKALLVSGQTVDISGNSSIPFLGEEGDSPFNNNPDGNPPYSKYLEISTDGSVPVGGRGRIEVQYFPIDGGTDTISKGAIQDSSNYFRTAVLTLTAAPTSCTGQPTGTVWNNSGSLGICP